MAKIKNWNKIKNQKLDWKKKDESEQIWVYPHKTWKTNPRTGNVTNYRTSHYSVRHYEPKGKSLASTLGGKEFKTQKEARRFALDYMKGL
jgi:hypothetical protein